MIVKGNERTGKNASSRTLAPAGQDKLHLNNV